MNRDLPSWPRLAVAAATVVGLGVGVAGTAVVVGLSDGNQAPGFDPGPVTLVSYDTCASALSELKSAALEHVGPYGLGGDYAMAIEDGGVAVDAQVAPGAAAPEMPGKGAQRQAAPGADSAGDAQSGSGQGTAPGAGNHSSTNVHESGVDEPDIVKTDGRRVVSIADGQLRVVDVASRKQTARLTLPNGYPTQLLLSGDRALVLTAGGGVAVPMPGGGGVSGGSGGVAPGKPAPTPIAPTRIAPGEPAPGKPAPNASATDVPATDAAPPDTPATSTPATGTPVPDEPTDPPPTKTPPVDPAYASQVVLVDLTGTGKVLGSLEVEGDYLDARQVGEVARVVVRSGPRLGFVYPDQSRSPDQATQENKNIVARSSIVDWMPRYQLRAAGRESAGSLVGCEAMSHPKTYTGTAMLTVLTFDLRRDLGVGDPVGIVADGNTVYGTGTDLYIADDHFEHGVEGFGPADRPLPAGSQRTDVYQFDISGPGKPVHVASGGVEGTLLNQYSLSEHKGNLRLATTVGMAPDSRSMVTVLSRKGDQLAQVGRVDGLGTGERIYAVRFLGDTGYVVTFRQTDPLYTVDLSDPAKPRVTGELKITGYSAYLHPVGDGRLLGIGQEATKEGQVSGTQVSLFDTSNPAGAKRIAQFHYAGGMSEVENDPHAFLYWPDKQLVVIPVNGGMMDPAGASPVSGALVLKLGGTQLSEVGMVSHVAERYGTTPMAPRRALVIGNELWTVSDAGMLVSDLDRLTQLAWLPFT
ncbi:beta-propeller domain-containing protein [Actinophytocola sp.]|uniref:beta-propeller domain-containing protein n=1 Tax=Actinophytocola sp. TaxID=1872138 RepID=UPI002EDAE1FE